MKPPAHYQKLFAHVTSKEEARKVWRENKKELDYLIENHPCGEGFKNFMTHHIPWVIKKNLEKARK